MPEPGGHGRDRDHALGVAHALLADHAVGDVADEAGEELSGENLTDREIDGEDGAVASACAGLSADADDAPLARAAIAGEIGVVLIAIGRGHEDGDVASDELGGGVAEHLLARAVDGLDLTLAVDRDDRVGGGVEDRGQSGGLLAEMLPALLELGFDALAGGDVDVTAEHPLGLAVLVVEQRGL